MVGYSFRVTWCFRQGEQCSLPKSLLENSCQYHSVMQSLGTHLPTKEQRPVAPKLLLLRLQGTGGVALLPLFPLLLVSCAHKLTASRLGSGASSFASHVTRPTATSALSAEGGKSQLQVAQR